MMKDFVLMERKAAVEEYIDLRSSIGWKTFPYNKIKRGLENSIYCVCVEYQNKLIGFGRIVGDGCTVFYIQDIMVSPLYQNRKIGTAIMEKLMDYIETNCIEDAIVGLIATDELHKFYSRFGFACNEKNLFYRLKR